MVATAFGPPEVMEMTELPDPEPGPGQVLVQVEFSDVGTLDRLVRAGWGSEVFPITPPYVPGDGVGGTVVRVAPDVDASWLGRRVAGGTGPRDEHGRSAAPTGGYAERAAVDVGALVAVPDELELGLATSLLNDGVTSQMLLGVADPQPGDSALVLSAAGAGGVLVVQLLAARGVTVVAAARGDHKTQALRELGVAHVVDYGAESWPEQVRELLPSGATTVFDGAGAQLGIAGFGLVADGGRFLSYGSSSGEFAAPDVADAERRGITVAGLFDLPAPGADDRVRLAEKAFAAALDHTAVPILTRRPLAEAPRAHAALEDRSAVGKTVLVVGKGSSAARQ